MGDVTQCITCWLAAVNKWCETAGRGFAGASETEPRATQVDHAPPANDPCLVVVFVSTPGLGKTSICEALQNILDPARYHVVHHHSDAQSMPKRKRFWPRINSLALTQRGDGRATIVLADKNLLDSPQGGIPWHACLAVASSLRCRCSALQPFSMYYASVLAYVGFPVLASTCAYLCATHMLLHGCQIADTCEILVQQESFCFEALAMAFLVVAQRQRWPSSGRSLTLIDNCTPAWACRM